jgi:predicted RNase H-like HicB family nuclease
MLKDVSEMTTYFALVRKDPESDYGVDFPDFPGCVTAGTTFEEACLMANEALQFHIEGMVEDGALIPAPSSLDVIMSDPHNTNATVIQVSLPHNFQQVTR